MKSLLGNRSNVSWGLRRHTLSPLVACLVVFLAEHAAYGTDGLVFNATTIECTAAVGDAPTSAVFEFTNHAARAISIKRIRTSCGCVEAKTNANQYEAGQEGQLNVVIKPSKKVPQQKSIIVETDDSSGPRIVLLLRINPPSTAKPVLP